MVSGYKGHRAFLEEGVGHGAVQERSQTVVALFKAPHDVSDGADDEKIFLLAPTSGCCSYVHWHVV
jgi:hypothetical protein